MRSTGEEGVEARMKDLVYIDRIDQITAKFVDKLLEEDKLEKFLDRMLEEGKGKDLQAIMISLGITLDKRKYFPSAGKTQEMMAENVLNSVLYLKEVMAVKQVSALRQASKYYRKYKKN